MRRINVNTFKSYCEFIAGKNSSSGWLSPSDFNVTLPIIVNKMVRKYYGVPEQYQPASPQPAIAYEITQLVTDYIGQLKKDVILSVDSTGVAPLPADYLHKSQVSATYFVTEEAEKAETKCCDTAQVSKPALKKVYGNMVPVTVLTDQEIAAWASSSLRVPDKEYPVCTFKGGNIEFMPRTIRTALLTYLRYPQTPVWNYTIVNNYPVYNPTGSVDIELPEICADELMATLLVRLGMVIREGGLIEFSRYVKESGM